MKKNNNKRGTLWGAPFLLKLNSDIYLERYVKVKKSNRFLILIIREFMNFDVILCYNNIDYVMEVGDSLSHF